MGYTPQLASQVQPQTGSSATDAASAQPTAAVTTGEVTAGKYLLIEVPNFNDATAPAEAMSSYLRLGAVKDVSIAASPSAPRESGEDLAAQVTSFVDDDRVRDGCPEFVPPAVRQAETALLHTKGGWRDHSDGNRITTTRGDKVEVIQGNYRMLVMGRQNHDSGFDLSGGHVEETGITVEGSSEIRWEQTWGGTWKIIEESVKGDVLTTYHGDVRDYYYGMFKESTVGCETPMPYRENPSIIDKTWAARIESYTGSAALPVPLIKDETYAMAMESTTTVETSTTATTAKTISDTTLADSITSTTTVSGAISDTTTAASVTSTTTAATVDDTIIGDSSSTIIGSELETIIGNESEIIVGNESSITVGATEDLNVGVVLDITVALMFEVFLGGGLEISIGPRKTYSLFHLKNAQSELTVANVKSDLRSLWNVTSGVVNVIAGKIHLG